MWNNSNFGTPPNTPFTHIWKNCDEFLADYKDSGIYEFGVLNQLNDSDIKLIYFLIYGRHGNDSIAPIDRTRFKYRLFSIIFQYGPTWKKKLEIQNDVRNLTSEDLRTGSKAIYNHAYNPGTAPSTDTLTELEAINEQNTTKYTKSKIDALNLQWEMLTNDVTNAFLDKFKPLFVKVVKPIPNLWFVEDDENED